MSLFLVLAAVWAAFWWGLVLGVALDLLDKGDLEHRSRKEIFLSVFRSPATVLLSMILRPWRKKGGGS